MAEVGMAIAVEAVVILLSRVVAEVKTHREQLERANNYVCKPILHIDEATLRATLGNAQEVDRKPAIHTEDKETLKEAYNEAHDDLQKIELYLKQWRDTAGYNLVSIRKALRKLDKVSRSFDVALKRFGDLTHSLYNSNPGAELKLKSNDFRFLAGYNRRIHNTFVYDARITRQIQDVPAGDIMVYVESRRYYASDSNESKSAAEQEMILLNQKLAKVKRVVGIPLVLGFQDEPPREKDRSGSFQLVMSIPSITKDFERSSLKWYLANFGSMPSLNDRVNLCVQLAEAVLHVHEIGIVHKKIQPENILVIRPNKDIPGIQGALYLVGWQSARRMDGATNKAGAIKWHRRIYQHPKRQGKRAESEYKMEHDVYSLGVCMLEILRWMPLVESGSSGQRLCKDVKTTFCAVLDNDGSANNLSDKEISEHASLPKVLLAMAEAEIPLVAGVRMARVVSDCLSGRAVDEVEEGQNKARTPVNVAVSFVESVLDTVRNVVASI